MNRTALFSALVLITELVNPLPGQEKPRFAGPTENGYLLPNGWTVTPAGKQVLLTDLPLNILPLADGNRALAATSGYNKHELSLIDLNAARVIDQQTVRQSWFGLVLDPQEEKIWWAGGGANALHTFTLKENKLTRTSPAEPDPALRERSGVAKPKAFKSGLTLDPKNQILFFLDIETGTITAQSLRDDKSIRTNKLGGRPYDVVLARNGTHLYVSDWAGGTVLVLKPEYLRLVAKIPVGEHPTQMAFHPKDNRLFVACASSNCVTAIDTMRGVVTETIMTALFPRSPQGSTPDALAIAPDGQTLYVANADNNCVAVIDISVANESQVKGFIPTGWYPTSVAVTPNGKTLLVGVGKGNQTRANPFAKIVPEDKASPRRSPYPYIGTILSGSLSIVAIPDEKQLSEYTATVYRNCPYSDKILTNVPAEHKTAVPSKVGDSSPIKHVIYIIKENRTYDQVFGDMKEGNSDPALVMFGENVTPNHHKLAREFVLLDNLYCNGHVSRDGHPWSTMAYNTDYVARDWALTYSKRAGISDDDQGNLSKAPSGYLWDACARAGLTYRSYGEYGGRVSQPDGSIRMEGRVPGLIGHMCPDYALSKNGKKLRDPENVDVFLKEFRQFEKNNNLPRFIIMSLGEDHTTGTTPGTFTPEACVASNDLALGRLVEEVSNSKYWPETAIFVIEDDAQNGPDHVDAHRTVGLVISPYAKRHFLDSTQYATVSMIRSIELILGLPPLSQYDAAARPMFASFTDKPDPKPYTHEKARIDLQAINLKTAYGAERSRKMDFSDYDKIDAFELNEILWRSIKGTEAPLPPAVRQAIAYRPMERTK
ncbi:MAG TPA: bifunctional YncE family protein/alkaline phosphatase family protein [Gemmataceae bacterium]|nr:bifunctional YncE family protein/alkaline phosphatase family protein [Gemmataceae bacterium]